RKPQDSQEARTADAGEGEVAGLKVAAAVAQDPKCGRCWHRRPTVGENPDHPELCDRCVTNIEGAGEERRAI
ncbi:MAG: zinc finger domain-containing protein, partial [Thiohalorhabdaceae bacterium]